MNTSRNQHNKDVTHRLILESALQVFSRKGYRDATIKEIHLESGFNALTIFRHFKDKETLFHCVVEEYRDLIAMDSELDVALDAGDLATGLRALSCNYFRVLFQNLDILRIYINECMTFPALQESAWFISPRLRRHMEAHMDAAGLKWVPHDAELFVGYITKLCLEFNSRDRVWEYSDALQDTFLRKMERQTVFLSDSILRRGDSPGAV